MSVTDEELGPIEIGVTEERMETGGRTYRPIQKLTSRNSLYNLYYYIKGSTWLNLLILFGLLFALITMYLRGAGSVMELTPRLHIVTCETRTIKEVFVKSISRIDGASLVNVCEGQEWTGFFLKLEQLNIWLKEKQLPNDDIVFVVDSGDLVFNYTGSATQLVETVKILMGSSEMLVMAEPSLWMGFVPKDSGVSDLYYHDYDLLRNDKTTCPSYINGGGYVTSARYLEFVMGALLDPDSHESDADDLLMKNYGVGNVFSRDDQAALTRLRMFYPDKIRLDYHQDIFASLWDTFPCPEDEDCPTIQVLNCGHVEHCYEELTMNWTLNISNLQLTRKSQWSDDCKLNPYPIILHGNGSTGKPKYYKEIAEPLLNVLNLSGTPPPFFDFSQSTMKEDV